MKKKLSLMLAVILILQIMLPMLTIIWENALTLKSVAQEDLVEITFEDENMYNAMVKALGNKVTDTEAETKTIKMTEENINSVTQLNLQYNISSKIIKNIAGIEKFTNLNCLRLDNNNISDNISILSNLTNLKELNLTGNGISDIRPLEGLTNLTKLDLSYNKISDLNPLKKLKSLADLDLQWNKITDIEPLKELKSLSILDLSYNEATSGVILSNIEPLKELPKLTSLRFSGNYPTYRELMLISELTSLAELDLSNDHISDIEPLKELKNLDRLVLSHNQINDLEPLRGLTSLTSLYLYNNQISDISTLGKLTSLTYLDLENNQISDVSTLGELTKLKTLSLENNQISDISTLGKLTSLTYLNLENNQISDIEPLKELKNLDRLVLSHNQISDISALEGLTISYLWLRHQELTTTAIEGQTIELPPIFKSAKDSNSKGYTEQEFTLTNCTLSEDKTKITINKDVEEASVTINGGGLGGGLDGSKLMITVKELDSITITQAPSKTEYVEGQTFNKAGMEVTAHYNNGTTAVVENYTTSPTEPLTINDKTITVSYEENGITQTATQAITVVLKGDANGDGKVDFKDILVINKHRLGKTQLTGIYLEAADVTGDGKADFTDILKINKYRLGKINSL